MPKPHVQECLLDIDRDRLFRALTDLKRWPAWDDDIQAVDCDTPMRAGAHFTIRLKDGSTVALAVEALEAPGLFIDRAKLPLARMLSRHVVASAPRPAMKTPCPSRQLGSRDKGGRSRNSGGWRRQPGRSETWPTKFY
jgi:hypothetical protein